MLLTPYFGLLSWVWTAMSALTFALFRTIMEKSADVLSKVLVMPLEYFSVTELILPSARSF